MSGPPIKRVALLVEWRGACSEREWGLILAGAIEESDASGATRVVKIDCQTQYGTTEVIPPEEMRRLGYRPNPPKAIRQSD